MKLDFKIIVESFFATILIGVVASVFAHLFGARDSEDVLSIAIWALVYLKMENRVK